MQTKCDRTVHGWQIHTLDIPSDAVMAQYPTVKIRPMVFTATVLDDPTGKWEVGFHMRSTLIVDIDFIEGIIQTVTKTYKIEGPEGDGRCNNQDLGNAALHIFY